MALELVVLVTWEGTSQSSTHPTTAQFLTTSVTDTSVYVSVQSVSSVLLREKTTYEWMGILEDTDVENQSLPLVRAMIVRDAEVRPDTTRYDMCRVAKTPQGN